MRSALASLPPSLRRKVLFKATPTSIPAGGTFTRSTVGTYVDANGVVQTAAINTLRSGHYVGGVTRTNLALQSQAMETAAWAVSAASIVTDAVLAPDGTLTAEKLVEDSSAATVHLLLSAANVTVFSAATYTHTVYAKAGERPWIQLAEGQGVTAAAYFNLATGVVGTVAGTGSPSASITAAANGWYRCSLTFTTIGTVARMRVYLSPSDGGATYTGNGTSGAYVWGAQIERNTTATAYIPTTTTAVSVFDGNTGSILLEAAATNKCIQNGDLTNAAWFASNLTAALDGTVLAPDGTSSTKLTAGASVALRGVYASAVSESSGATITWSSPMKMGTCRFAQLNLSFTAMGVFVNVDLQTGTLGTSGANGGGVFVNAGVINLGNGWYRAWMAASIPSTTYNVGLLMVGASNSVFNATDATTGQTLNASLAQYEVSAFPTSIIKTVAAAVTRAVDNDQNPYTAPPQPLTAYAKFVEGGTILLSASVARILHIGAVSNAAAKFFIAANGPYTVFHDNGATVTSTLGASPVLGDTVELMATLFADGSVQLTQSINGAATTASVRSAANAIAASWSSPLLHLNSLNGSNAGVTTLQKVVVAPGIRSFAEMQNL